MRDGRPVTVASNGGTATANVTGINIDSGHATVKVTGPKNKGTYKRKAPKAVCRATEKLSGVASCKLTTSKQRVKHGHRYTVTAKATTKAGVVSTKKLVYTVLT